MEHEVSCTHLAFAVGHLQRDSGGKLPPFCARGTLPPPGEEFPKCMLQ